MIKMASLLYSVGYKEAPGSALMQIGDPQRCVNHHGQDQRDQLSVFPPKWGGGVNFHSGKRKKKGHYFIA